MLGATDIAFLGVGSGIKLLLWPAYHSTDFEVHRNWLAITGSQALRRWYVEDTSEWTLDYPPFFAWFEWVLAHAARWWDPQIVRLDSMGYASSSCVAFQRLSVMVSELVLYAALGRFVRASGSSMQSKIAAALVFLSPGFLFVDHVHFQYNGFLFGILVYSLVFAMEGRDLLAGATFAALLCFKHIFMYIAPAYFVYLLLNYCVVRGSQRRAARGGRLDMRASAWRLAKLGAVVLAVFGAAFGPFAALGQLPQLGARLFPFKRGLCHAFWAPNFWALYAAADRLLLVALRAPASASSTRGLVGDTSFGVLPAVPPLVTFAATLLAQLPACIVLVRGRRSPQRFVQSVVLCAYASFLFGWHVHEKAIILILAPLGLLMAAPSQRTLRMFAVLATAGYYSLFPLLFGAQELPVKAALLLMWVLCALALLRSDRNVAAWACLSAPERAYVLGHVPLFVAAELVPSAAFGRLQFLPLALVSVYTALGVTYSWLGLLVEFLRP
ncbi:glycosyl transferase [Coemansia thaxteri]|uniref:Alpha-1,3-glucosyltransferase n=1 Tax=Coemansia thaxteri TaxID=2663907 RepID=A0A9W8BF48_9FUNG|nr:glycosyl transferase [Coemansia thaxteri]KAJ2483249.1 glycosyl transferase [Coemansia sp. RSA 2320]